MFELRNFKCRPRSHQPVSFKDGNNHEFHLEKKPSTTKSATSGKSSAKSTPKKKASSKKLPTSPPPVVEDAKPAAAPDAAGATNLPGGMTDAFQRMPLAGAGGSNMCLLHHQPLRYYSETSEELICYDCTVMGPHNTPLHRISSIEEAFRQRFDLINRSIYETLVPKRAQLISQICAVDFRLEEIKTVKNIIEKDIRNEYGAIMERLRSAEGVKNAVLQHDIAEL